MNAFASPSLLNQRAALPWLLSLSLLAPLAGCVRHDDARAETSEATARPTRTTAPAARPEAGGSGEAPAEGSANGAPRVEMRNLRLVVLEGAVLEVKSLSGELEPTRVSVVPYFDDPSTFRIAIDRAETSIDAASLAALLNGYTFAGDDSPLDELEVEIRGDRIHQKGKLKKKVELPFEIEASLSLTPEGFLRLHPEKIQSAGVPVKGVLDLFDIELQEVINSRPERGIRVDGDDLLLDPSRLTPPPAIRGRVSEARIEGDRIVLVFAPADGGRRTRRAADPPLGGRPNYMMFTGGRLRFGKLQMSDTDLAIFDADPRDPFLFFLSRYRTQLVAGTTRTLDDLGLVAFFPDYDETGSATGSSTGTAAARPRDTSSRP